MRISDWSSDVCSSDLAAGGGLGQARCISANAAARGHYRQRLWQCRNARAGACHGARGTRAARRAESGRSATLPAAATAHGTVRRSEEHTSELQSLMRISYAVFCLKKKKNTTMNTNTSNNTITHEHNREASASTN